MVYCCVSNSQPPQIQRMHCIPPSLSFTYNFSFSVILNCVVVIVIGQSTSSPTKTWKIITNVECSALAQACLISSFNSIQPASLHLHFSSGIFLPFFFTLYILFSCFLCVQMAGISFLSSHKPKFFLLLTLPAQKSLLYLFPHCQPFIFLLN